MSSAVRPGNMPDNEDALQARDIGKVFGASKVLDSIDLALGQGEVIALLGPSGCGKTTLLRIAAGLMAPTAGALSLAGRVVAESGGRLVPPEARGLGMVFQDYALWPHLTVGDNVAFPLRMRGIGRSERRAGARAALARVGLEALAERYPGTLSGGQQQRVALARAIVAEPPLVLFDEPLSNLDRELREGLALEIAQLLRELRLSALYVTHDQAEAFAIADRVAIMQHGRIAQIDTPERLFTQPATVEVARFLDIGAILEGSTSAGRFRTSCGLEIAAPVPAGPVAGGGPAHLLVPRTAVRPVAAADGELRARVTQCRFQGDRYLLRLNLNGASGVAELLCPADRPARSGEEVGLAMQHDRLRLFPAAA